MANILSPITTDLEYHSRRALALLKARLVAAGLVRLNTDGAAVAAPGDSISIPNVVVEGGASARLIGGAAVASDISTFSKTVQMGEVYEAVSFDNLEKTFSSIPLQEEVVSQLVYGVAKKIDSTVCDLWNFMPYETGEVDGTAFANSTDKVQHLNTARKILVDNNAPLDELHLIVNSQEAWNLRELDLLRLAQNYGDAGILKTGVIGQVAGFTVHESTQISSATVTATAVWDTPVIDNGPGYAIGTSSIAVTGLGAGSLLKGSSFKLGNYRYVVTATTAIVANSIAALPIFPQLKEAVINAQALTPTSHSAAGSVGLAFHRDAMLLVNRPFAPFSGGVVSSVATDDQTGLSLMVAMSSRLLGGAGEAMSHQIAVRALVGAAVVRPELVVRVFGQV